MKVGHLKASKQQCSIQIDQHNSAKFSHCFICRKTTEQIKIEAINNNLFSTVTVWETEDDSQARADARNAGMILGIFIFSDIRQ